MDLMFLHQHLESMACFPVNNTPAIPYQDVHACVKETTPSFWPAKLIGDPENEEGNGAERLGLGFRCAPRKTELFSILYSHCCISSWLNFYLYMEKTSQTTCGKLEMTQSNKKVTRVHKDQEEYKELHKIVTLS